METQVVSSDSSSRALRTYVLLQIPEAVLVSLVLFGLHYWEQVSVGTAFLLAGGWLIKEVVMYPLVRKAYEPGPPHGTDALLGVRAVAADALSPEGPVRVGPELWNARLEEGARFVVTGESVTVKAVDGFVLIVAPVEPEASTRDPAS
jgi:membrane protein implicated in regulation of membrane protease activity